MQSFGKIIYLITKLQDGRNAWFIAELKSSIKATILQKIIKQNQAHNLKDYANILHAGVAANAPVEVLEYVNKKYKTSFV